VHVLTKEEGGRHNPFYQNYRPQFYFLTTDVTGTVELKEGAQMLLPGDNAELTIELQKPVALEEMLRHSRGQQDSRRRHHHAHHCAMAKR